jgi:hypothetical protein
MLENLDGMEIDIKRVAEMIGQKILLALNQPFYFATGDYVSTPSIGIALFNGKHTY